MGIGNYSGFCMGTAEITKRLMRLSHRLERDENGGIQAIIRIMTIAIILTRITIFPVCL